MRVYLCRHYKILLRQCASKTEFAFVSPAKRAHRCAHTLRAYISFKGAKNASVCAQRQGMRVHTNTQMHTDAHAHKCYKTLLRRCVHRWPTIHIQATERLRGPSGSFSRVHIMRSHFILHPYLSSRTPSVIVCVRIMSADGAT